MLYRNDPFCKFYLRGDAVTDRSASAKAITNPRGLVSVAVSGAMGGKGIDCPGYWLDDYLEVPETGTLFDLGRLWTIDAEVSLDVLTNGSGYRWICGYEGMSVGDDFWGFYLQPNDGAGALLSMQWKYAGGAYRVLNSTGFSLSANTPTHFRAAADGTTIRLFVNGRNVSGSMPTFDPLNFVTGTRRGLFVAGYNNGGTPTHRLDGKISALCVSRGICRATAAGFSKPNRLP